MGRASLTLSSEIPLGRCPLRGSVASVAFLQITNYKLQITNYKLQRCDEQGSNSPAEVEISPHSDLPLHTIAERSPNSWSKFEPRKKSNFSSSSLHNSRRKAPPIEQMCNEKRHERRTRRRQTKVQPLDELRAAVFLRAASYSATSCSCESSSTSTSSPASRRALIFSWIALH